MTTFHSRYLNQILHLKPEHNMLTFDGKLVPQSAVYVTFTNGTFKTDDPEIIELLRNHKGYKDKEVWEFTPLDDHALKMAEEFKKAHSQKVIRGAITTKTIHEEAKVAVPAELLEPEDQVDPIKASTTKCDICGKEFPDDFAQRKVRMHRVSHRKKKEEQE